MFVMVTVHWVVAVALLCSMTEGCTLAPGSLESMRLQVSPTQLLTFHDGILHPSADVGSYINWRQHQLVVHRYTSCADHTDKVTIRHTTSLTPKRKFHLFDKSGSIDFERQYTSSAPVFPQQRLLHTFHPGPEGSDHYLDYITFTAPSGRSLKPIVPSGAGYQFGSTAWNVFPNPKSDGKAFGILCVPGGSGRRRRDISINVARCVQAFRFEIFRYKMYTGFDGQGRFKYVRAVVLKDPDEESYIAPKTDRDSLFVPLCETKRMSKRRQNVRYQSVSLRPFNDVARARRSPFISANISDPYLADERFFVVEEAGEGRVRLRLTFDPDKYLAILRKAQNRYELVVTTFRRGVADILTYEFDIDLPSPKQAIKRPQTPCTVNRTCPWPGEVKEISSGPNIKTVSSRLSPCCGYFCRVGRRPRPRPPRPTCRPKGLYHRFGCINSK